MSVRAIDCMARIRLGAAELDWLATLPDPQHSVEPVPWCQLQHDHAGPHAALGQSSASGEWWVRWTLDAFEVVNLPTCTVESGEPDDIRTTTCGLPEGHPGAHGFQLP